MTAATTTGAASGGDGSAAGARWAARRAFTWRLRPATVAVTLGGDTPDRSPGGRPQGTHRVAAAAAERCQEMQTPMMPQQTTTQAIKGQGAQLIDQIKQLIHEGNVRRIVVKQDERTVAEFPLTVGVVGAAAAPYLAAIGALVALLTDCTIEVECVGEEPMKTTDGMETTPKEDYEVQPNM